ncbi:P-loop containing nucleoside triphosphate hydrolase protein, partial [Rhizodiscina lignyota]
LLIGISGPSSSGKTTLSRLLRDVLNSSPLLHAFILHEDDFYKTDAEIPVNTDGLQDWDCLESIDLPLLEKTLAHVKEHGSLPAGFESKEDKNDVGKVDIDWGVIERQTENLKQKVQTLQQGHERGKEAAGEASPALTIAIIDGFLLFAPSMASIRSLFSVKLFLRTDYATAKRRREARSGYVTLEGFWEDPPGYVDKVVWPNYVKDHSFLFRNGDVEGELNEGVCTELGIVGMPKGLEGNMTGVFEWA